MPKADIATISPLLLIVGLTIPALASHAVSNRPLDMLMVGLPLKITTSVLGWFAVQATYWAYQDGGNPGISFFGPLVVILVLNEIAGSLVFISLMSFFAKISDPTIGGTYMTLLNTIANIGSKWPNVTALYLLPKLTFARCESALAAVRPFTENVMMTEMVASSAAAAAAAKVVSGDHLRGGVPVAASTAMTAMTAAATAKGTASATEKLAVQAVASGIGAGTGAGASEAVMTTANSVLSNSNRAPTTTPLNNRDFGLGKIDCSRGALQCRAQGGTCRMLLDGFTIETCACVFIGVLWILIFRDIISRLQYKPHSEWMITRNSSSGKSGGTGTQYDDSGNIIGEVSGGSFCSLGHGNSGGSISNNSINGTVNRNRNDIGTLNGEKERKK
jgi:hypothetical protein